VLLFVALAIAAVAALWFGYRSLTPPAPPSLGAEAAEAAGPREPLPPTAPSAATGPAQEPAAPPPSVAAATEPEPAVAAPNGAHWSPDGWPYGQGGTPPTPAAIGPGDEALVALVIDDLGRSLGDVEALAALGVPVTYAVLPFESRTPEVAASLAGRGAEMLLHLPMEAAGGADPGPGTLLRAMTAAELAAGTRRALAAVPGAVGVNNHMGSVLSADEPSMRAVLAVLGERGLFFLDSRTSPDTIAYRAATDLGIPAAERQVFLDPDPDPEAVRAQFHRLLATARARGAAIAIGHPLPSTLAVLAEEVPRARALGYRFVPVSYLLDRSGDLP
jgi:hypothetical protein